jgi:hypothetical protein
MSSDPNTRIPTFKDLGNPSFSGPRPNPSPHMGGHVPPPVPFTPPRITGFSGPTFPTHDRLQQPREQSVATSSGPSISSFATTCAVLGALYAWLVIHGGFAVIGGYALAGAAVGAVAAIALAIAVKVFELAVKLVVVCLKVGVVLGLLYLAVLWLAKG